MGVAGYSEMAHMLGLYDVAEKYAGIAKKMAVKWEEMANEGDHYRLAFDRNNTWSQKYNIIWDKMWNLNICNQQRSQLLFNETESLWVTVRFSQRVYKV